ncbi:MAG TPA: S24 family peptidase [Pseudoduganella sp.]
MGQQDKTEQQALTHQRTTDQEPDLVPGFRTRLVSELDEAGVDMAERVRYLSSGTGRAAQSVMRWISQKSPGLPDLRSLAILCLRLQVDANWMLGLIRARRPFPRESTRLPLCHWLPDAPSSDWFGRLDFHMDKLAQGYDVYLMKGDDMAPVIGDGMPFLVDSSVSQLAGNGIYFLSLKGTSMVRYVELSTDHKFCIRCANERYREITVDRASAKGASLQVHGKVCMAFELKRF